MTNILKKIKYIIDEIKYRVFGVMYCDEDSESYYFCDRSEFEWGDK